MCKKSLKALIRKIARQAEEEYYSNRYRKKGIFIPERRHREFIGVEGLQETLEKPHRSLSDLFLELYDEPKKEIKKKPNIPRGMSPSYFHILNKERNKKKIKGSEIKKYVFKI